MGDRTPTTTISQYTTYRRCFKQHCSKFCNKYLLSCRSEPRDNMSMDGVSASSVCGCDCHLGDGQFSPTEQCAPSLDWERCECVLCGEDGCRNLVKPELRISVLIARGIPPQNVADIEASPNYCGDCRDHCLLEIRRAAVLRGRAKRQHKEAESKTKAIIQRGASRSRSPLHEKKQDY